LKGQNFKGLRLLLNRATQSVVMNFDSKQVAVQSVLSLEKLAVLSFINQPGQLSSPCILEDCCFMIPSAKHLVKIDMNAILKEPTQLSIDMKNTSG
jgi:hypothetical protein